MEIKVKTYYISGMSVTSQLSLVNDKNKLLVEGRLKIEKENIKRLFKKLVKEGVIKSIRIPKNKKIQNKLDELVEAKRNISNSLEQIKIAFN